MAAMSFSSLSLQPPELSPAASYHRSSAASIPRRRRLSTSSATASPETSTAPLENPEIELQFIGEIYAVNKAKAISGEKLLRNIMSDNKIKLYATYIVEGSDLLNERINTELKYLKKVEVQRLPQKKK